MTLEPVFTREELITDMVKDIKQSLADNSHKSKRWEYILDKNFGIVEIINHYNKLITEVVKDSCNTELSLKLLSDAISSHLFLYNYFKTKQHADRK